MPIGAPSTADIYDIGLAVMSGAQPELVVRDGDVSDSFLGAGAAMASTIVASSAKSFRAVLVLGGRGADLTLTCHDRGVDRDTGDAAIGAITLSRAAAGNAGTFPAGTKVATDPSPIDGTIATFTTDTDLAFLAGDLSKTVTVTCTVIGSGGNVPRGAITRILDTPAFSSAFGVFNAIRMAGGNEAESDPDLQTRTTQFPLVLRRGTVDALQYGALLTPGVKRASVVNAAPGIVNIYVCDAAGNSNPTLAAAAQAIIDGPPAWRAAGDLVSCIASDLFALDVALIVTLRAGANANVVFPQITTAIAARLGRLNPGETLQRSIISTAGENADKTSIVSVFVVSPPADIVPGASQAIRLGTTTYG